MATHAPPGLVFDEELGRLLDHFAAAFGIRIAFFSADGRESRAGLKQQSIPFCRLLRTQAGQEAACRRQDRAMFQEAIRTRTRVDYRCHAGLRESVQPVHGGDGTLLGILMIGQFRTPEDALTAKGLAPASRKALGSEFDRAPVIASERLSHVLAFFTLIVETVMSRRLVERRQDALIWRIERHLLENLGQPLSIADAAALTGRSPSTISHDFKKRTGASFKQRLLTLRLDAAEKSLRESECTVAEAARSVGYENPFLFSRLFRKHRGIPPSSVKRSRMR